MKNALICKNAILIYSNKGELDGFKPSITESRFAHSKQGYQRRGESDAESFLLTRAWILG